VPDDEVAAADAAVAQLLQNVSEQAEVRPDWSSSLAVDFESSLLSGAAHALVCPRSLLVFVVVVRGRYPEQLSMRLLRELAEEVAAVESDERLANAEAGELGGAFRSLLRDVSKRYGDPARLQDYAVAREKVDKVKELMPDNIRKILEAHAAFDAVPGAVTVGAVAGSAAAAPSEEISDCASQFLKQSVGVRREVKLRNVRLKVLVAACTSVFVIYTSMVVLGL